MAETATAKASISDRAEGLLSKLEGAFDRWLAEFEAKPLSAMIKLLMLLYIIRFVRRNLL